MKRKAKEYKENIKGQEQVRRGVIISLPGHYLGMRNAGNKKVRFGPRSKSHFFFPRVNPGNKK